MTYWGRVARSLTVLLAGVSLFGPAQAAPALPHDSSTDAGLLLERLEDRRPASTGARVDASLTLDNRGNRIIGPEQLQGELVGNGVLGFREITSLQLLTTPLEARGLRFISLGQRVPIGATPVTISFQASNLSAHFARARAPGVRAEASRVTLGLEVALPNPGRHERRLMLELAGLDDSLALYGARIEHDQVRHTAVQAEDKWTYAGGTLLANASVTRGLGGLGATTAHAAFARRVGNVADFTKVNLDLLWEPKGPGPFGAKIRLAGQYTRDALPQASAFALGGAMLGRAYEAAIVAGDSGYAASIELTLDQKLPVPKTAMQAYIFADAGQVQFVHPVPAVSRQSLASAGIGVRFVTEYKQEAEIELAAPIVRPVASAVSPAASPRIFFRFVQRF